MVDSLIYAEFLPDSDSLLNLPILTLIRSSLEKEILMYDDNDDETASSQLPFKTANCLQPDKEGLSMDLLAEDSATEPEEEAGEEEAEEEEEEDVAGGGGSVKVTFSKVTSAWPCGASS